MGTTVWVMKTGEEETLSKGFSVPTCKGIGKGSQAGRLRLVTLRGLGFAFGN